MALHGHLFPPALPPATFDDSYWPISKIWNFSVVIKVLDNWLTTTLFGGILSCCQRGQRGMFFLPHNHSWIVRKRVWELRSCCGCAVFVLWYDCGLLLLLTNSTVIAPQAPLQKEWRKGSKPNSMSFRLNSRSACLLTTFLLTLVQLVMASSRLRLMFLLTLASSQYEKIPVFILMEFWTTLESHRSWSSQPHSPLSSRTTCERYEL